MDKEQMDDKEIAGMRVNVNRTPYTDELICRVVANEIRNGEQPVIDNSPCIDPEAPMWERIEARMYIRIGYDMILIRWTPTEEGYRLSEETGDESHLCDWEEIAYAKVDRDMVIRV